MDRRDQAKDVIPVCLTLSCRYAGERISSAFVEATVNAVISKRLAKKQQMQWSKSGALSSPPNPHPDPRRLVAIDFQGMVSGHGKRRSEARRNSARRLNATQFLMLSSLGFKKLTTHENAPVYGIVSAN